MASAQPHRGWQPLVLASGPVLSFGYLWLSKSRWQEPHLAKEVSAPHRNIGKLMMWLVHWRRKSCALCSRVTDLHSHWRTNWLDVGGQSSRALLSDVCPALMISQECFDRIQNICVQLYPRWSKSLWPFKINVYTSCAACINILGFFEAL